MSEETVTVVGDKFHGFASVPGVRTISQLLSELSAGRFDDDLSHVTVVCGQGVSEFDREYVKDALERRDVASHVEFVYDPPRHARRTQVHKHDPTNVLVAEPRRTGPDTFEAQLRIHADNELLDDHQTGMHVQGMVVVEAVRQMFLSAFELGYRQAAPAIDYYVVWNSLDIEFQNFLFPLPGDITLTVVRCDLTDAAKLSFDTEVVITQSNRRASSATVSFTACDTQRMEQIERRRAETAVATATSIREPAV